MRQAAHGHELTDSESSRKLQALGQHGHTPGELHARPPADLAPEEGQLSGIRSQGAGEQAEQGRLATPVGPDQRNQLPCGDREIDPTQDVPSAAAREGIAERQSRSDGDLREVHGRSIRRGRSERHDSATGTRLERTSSQMKKGAPIRAVTMPTGIPPARRAPRSASASSAAP